MAEIDTGVIENSKRRVMIVKFEEAMNAYREMLLFYAARCMAEQAGEIELDTSFDNTLKWNDHHWVNAGGLLFHQQQLELLIDGIHKHEMVSWEDFHDVTDRFATEYPQANFLTAIGVLNKLGYQNLESVWHDQIQLLSKVRHRIHESRLKDYQNEFRKATSETEAEWNAVYGDLESEEQYQSILRFIETEIQRFSQLSLISH